MASYLTERQQNELHQAIFDYFMSQGDKFNLTLQEFRKETTINESDIGKGTLEKKWTSIIRLQKRIIELESKIDQMQSLISERPKEFETKDSRMIPKPPSRFCLTGHRAPITVVVTHPIFSIVASGSEDTTIRIWDHETGQYERTLKGHTGSITGLSFDKKGTLLASCSTDMSCKIWDINSYCCIRTLNGHDHTISSISFTLSNEFLISASRDKTIKIWEVSTGYCKKTFSEHNDWIKCISLNSELAASAGNDKSILIWNISNLTVIQVRFFKTITLIPIP